MIAPTVQYVALVFLVNDDDSISYLRLRAYGVGNLRIREQGEPFCVQIQLHKVEGLLSCALEKYGGLGEILELLFDRGFVAWAIS